MPSVHVRNVFADTFHVRCRVTRTTRQAATAKHGNIWQVISHIGHFILLQFMTPEKVTIILQFERRTEVNILCIQSQGMETMLESFPPPLRMPTCKRLSTARCMA